MSQTFYYAAGWFFALLLLMVWHSIRSSGDSDE